MEACIPQNVQKLRSCILCGLIENTSEWEKMDSCPNCKFPFNSNYEKITSASFNGIIAIFDPEKSWCANWQRFDHNIPGLYAINNEGEVTDEMLHYLEKNNRPLPEWVEVYKVSKSKD